MGRLANDRIDVLYIEDDPSSAKLVAALVQCHQGVHLEHAPDGTSGLASARRARPGLILLDINLPDTDGFRLLPVLRAEPALAETVIIAVSSMPASSMFDQAIDAGFDDFWSKPIDVDRFHDDLDRWRARAAGGSTTD